MGEHKKILQEDTDKKSNHPFCPECSSRTRATPITHPTRKKGIDANTWDRVRKYECPIGHTFQTNETYYLKPHVKIKRSERHNNEIQEFDLIKLQVSISLALGRERSEQAALQIANKVLRGLQRREKGEITTAKRTFSSRTVGEEVLNHLADAGEHVGWVRYMLIFESHSNNGWGSIQSILKIMSKKVNDDNQKLADFNL